MSDTVVAPRVLIAEDEPLIRMDLVELLESEGYQVVGQAADGEQAVQLAEELHPDICVLDVKMPVLDGISAAEIITAKGIAPVVMLTAFSQRDLVDRAARAGAMAYVVKPFQASDVVPAMALAMARFQQLQEIKEEVSDLSEQLEVRKLIDQAKGVLQERLGLSEAESFRWIQKTAMDLRKSKREVAEGVLAHGKK
ncbi:MAG: ANTAR domain-containing response regulator [Propionibacteriaceae bacterium]